MFRPFLESFEIRGARIVGEIRDTFERTKSYVVELSKASLQRFLDSLDLSSSDTPCPLSASTRVALGSSCAAFSRRFLTKFVPVHGAAGSRRFGAVHLKEHRRIEIERPLSPIARESRRRRDKVLSFGKKRGRA